MLARHRLTPCLERGSKIRDFVVQDMAAVKSANHVEVEMEVIEFLLELFDRVGDRIEACLRQTDYSEVASKLDLIIQLSRLLKEAGFDARLELDEIERLCA
ncbi:OLC1v1026552C1 [Oldenlandia corymbosa var. corymbosa]|uniref:OLC1v1026552C1 n=1 Tax=Oldenlandia corymbosa var. corymbosa TaxID=529605 RepID=A0AAV1C9B3_OLDCO|nr:OLC1v1026552C1 [Oldenlandia corymbosa var. corymbosa]